MNSTTWNGKVALVTGASRGIGKAIADKLAALGVSVALVARHEDDLILVRDEIVRCGGTGEVFACHMGNVDAINTMVEHVINHFGDIDIIVNNAATNPSHGNLTEVSWPAWDKTFDVNLKGYLAVIQAVYRQWQEHGKDCSSKSIINMASIAGLEGMPQEGVYAMTKAAIISMTKTLAAELGSKSIRVNAIAPGWVDTSFSRAVIQNSRQVDAIVKKTPLGRVGLPQDISGAAIFLASDESAYVTGSILTVDGGWTAA